VLRGRVTRASLKARVTVAISLQLPSLTLSKDVREYVRQCELCRKAKTCVKQHAGHQYNAFFYLPWERMGIDLIGPFPGGFFILHILCWATSFNFIVILPNKLSATVAKELFRFFQLFGEPQQLVSDNGKEFCNGLMDALLRNHGTKHVRCTPYNPRGNSRTERRHRDYNRILRIAINKYGKTWEAGAYVANWCLNAMPRPGTSVCPFELLLGFKPALPLDVRSFLHPEVGKFVKHTLSDVELMKQLKMHRKWCMDVVEQATLEVLSANKLSSDQITYTVNYELGDLVLLARPVIGSRAKGTTTRLMFQNIGPFEVVEKVNENVYRLRKLGTNTITTHNIKYMNSYLTKSAYETQTGKSAEVDAEDELDVSYVPQSGDYLLFVGLATLKKPWYLVEVVDYDEATDAVEFMYLNSRSTNPFRSNRCVWTCEDKLEIQSMTMPKEHGYVREVNSAQLEFFRGSPLSVQKTKKGINLSDKVVRKALHSAE
jgi:hypothetical protein